MDLKIGDVVVITNFEKNTDKWSPHYKGKVSVISRVDYPFYYLENDDTTPFTKEQLCVISTKENMKYKVGDKVRIKSLDWYNENKDENGNVDCGEWRFTKWNTPYCGVVMTIRFIWEDDECYKMVDSDHHWTDEMIEGLVEEETKPKFKVGDEVRIKGTDIGGTIESVIRGQLIVNSKGSKIPAWPEDVVLMKYVKDETALNKWTGLKVELELSKSVIGVSNVESLRGERFMSGFVKAIIPPEGYIFKDENGNVINATKIVLEKKKKEYPKTYKECCDVLGLNTMDNDAQGYKWELIIRFQELLIARDAYWKIAGEEMGLGKPWEPDWNGKLYYLYYNPTNTTGVVRGFTSDGVLAYVVLAFPTEEMRDAFKENFKELIEICKELL